VAYGEHGDEPRRLDAGDLADAAQNLDQGRSMGLEVLRPIRSHDHQ
jgi:hypothetical protein